MISIAQTPENKEEQQDSAFYRTSEQTDNGKPSPSQHESIHEMSTDEWRAAYEQEGCVDLWVEEEFNSGSRLMVSHSHCSLSVTYCAVCVSVHGRSQFHTPLIM